MNRFFRLVNSGRTCASPPLACRKIHPRLTAVSFVLQLHDFVPIVAGIHLFWALGILDILAFAFYSTLRVVTSALLHFQ